MAITKITDVIVPEVFTRYLRLDTADPSRLIKSGAAVRDAEVDRMLVGGGLTFNLPKWKQLPRTASNVASDNEATIATPEKVSALREVAVRCNRNMAWSDMDLAGELAGSDPMEAIGQMVGKYWEQQDEDMLVATLQGVFADNDAAPDATEHVEDDLTLDISGSSFTNGVTNFNAAAFIDVLSMFGDSDEPGLILCHPIVYATMRKNNLIDMIPDSQTNILIPTFMGKTLVNTRAVPNEGGSGAADLAAGLYHTWVLGAGAVRIGEAAADVPVETDRVILAGNGGGQEVLVTRVVRTMHPTGHAWIAASTASGGPTNATTTNNLAHADSWERRYPEREQIKIARLVTRENANT